MASKAKMISSAGFHLRGLTRKPDSERAAALASHGVDVVKGDLDEEATLPRALAGAWGASCPKRWVGRLRLRRRQSNRFDSTARRQQ
jgi:hypothetical protein